MEKKLVTNAKTRRRYDVSRSTIWRWDHDQKMRAMGWPAPIFINGRIYRDEAELDAFDASLKSAARNAAKPLPDADRPAGASTAAA